MARMKDVEMGTESTPIYTDRRQRSHSGGGKGFVIMLLILLVLAMGGTTWLYFDQINKNAALRQQMIDLNQSMSIVREALQITDESITDSNQSRNQKIDTLQKEVNKLWVQVSKKQKVQLQQLDSLTKLHTKEIREYTTTIEALAAGQNENFTALRKEITKQAEQLIALDEAVQQLSNNQPLAEVVEKNSRSLAKINNSRATLNSRIVKIQQEISLLKNKIITLENNQPIPAHNLETLGQ